MLLQRFVRLMMYNFATLNDDERRVIFENSASKLKMNSAKALKEKDLLRKVANFKAKFYPRKWVEYDKARIGTLKLMPAAHSINTLRKDYAKMKSMIFGYYPNFDELMSKIKEVESKINNA